MGLYLCIFNQSGEELEGVEVGHYDDFGVFRYVVAEAIERKGLMHCPVLLNHSDCDGEWKSVEARELLSELNRIEEALKHYPAIDYNSEWKKEVARRYGIRPKTLLDCFFDVDGEPLVERLQQLAKTSIETDQPILFQ